MNRPTLPTLIGMALGISLTLAFLHLRGPQERGIPPEEGLVSDSFALLDSRDPGQNGNRRSSWENLLPALSGKWTSVDGQVCASLDYRVLRFEMAKDWPDLENHTFPLGREMQFLSSRGLYDIKATLERPDEMWFCLQDSVTEALTTFTLYREGSPRAALRKPIPHGEPPPLVRDLLQAIPTIQQGERKNSVLQRMGLADLSDYELLGGEGDVFGTDQFFNLGIDDHWMLALAYRLPGPDSKEDEATLTTFKLFQGYVEDVREGRLEFEKVAYPFCEEAQIVTGPSKAVSAAPISDKR